jgi:uncharacterized protein YndB with AHSA1/START domain
MESIFKKDLDNKKMFITRAFKAPVELVWKAWTTPEILEEWWAPKPWKAKSVSMDFRNGGRWMYYMQGPEGEKSYCLADYSNIIENKSYEGYDSFCDEKGNLNPEFPRMHWKLNFSSIAEGAQVDIEITFAKLEDMEQILALGFKEGFTMAHGNLDEYLALQLNAS